MKAKELLNPIEQLACELFPMFQLLPNEGIEDVINRVVPVLKEFYDDPHEQ